MHILSIIWKCTCCSRKASSSLCCAPAFLSCSSLFSSSNNLNKSNTNFFVVKGFKKSASVAARCLLKTAFFSDSLTYLSADFHQVSTFFSNNKGVNKFITRKMNDVFIIFVPRVRFQLLATSHTLLSSALVCYNTVLFLFRLLDREALSSFLVL